MKQVYTLNIGNYFPELMELTIPLMKQYAKKIGADFIEITERKFPEYHIHYEKLQIYELGKSCSWNIFFDGDALIHPYMEDITKKSPIFVYLKDGYIPNIKFINCPTINNNKNIVGISSCFVATTNYNHNMWKPSELHPQEITDKIITSDENKSIGITSEFYQEEYVLTYNLAKNNYSYNGINSDYIFHSYKSNKKEDKLKEIKKQLNDWRI